MITKYNRGDGNMRDEGGITKSPIGCIQVVQKYHKEYLTNTKRQFAKCASFEKSLKISAASGVPIQQ